MSVADLLTERGRVIRRAEGSARDRYNHPVEESAEQDWLPCRIEQLGGYEQLDNQDTAVTDWVVFLPAGTPISRTDRFEHEREGLFEVYADPEQLSSPLGATGADHVEARLRRVEGR